MRKSLGALSLRQRADGRAGGLRRGASGADVARRTCSPRRRLFAATLALVLSVPIGVLVAQDDPSSREGVIRAPTPPAAAVMHYEKGRREYLAGRYREALTELKAALALDPNSPNLVYNVARVNEDLREFDDAIKYYRRYRSLLPAEAEDEREKTAMTIRRLQGAKDEQVQQEIERAKREGRPPPPQPAAPSDGRADAAFWIIAGTGLALAAGGGVTGLLALRREKQVSDFVLGRDGTFEARDAVRKQADELALASDVMSVAAGAAILSAAVLFFARSTDPESEDETGVIVTPLVGGVGLHGQF